MFANFSGQVPMVTTMGEVLYGSGQAKVPCLQLGHAAHLRLTVSLEGRDVVTCSYCTPENRASLEDDSDDRIDEESGDRESDDDEPLYPLSIKLKGSTMEPRYQRTLTDVDAGMDQGQQFDIQVEFEPTKPSGSKCVPSFDKH